MTNLETKIQQFVESVAKGTGALEIGVDILTGAVKLNGVEFSMEDQKNIIEHHRHDPTMRSLLKHLQGSDAGKSVRQSVQLSGGHFTVNKEEVEKTYGIQVPTGTYEGVGGVEITVEDEKDREIRELKEQLANLQAQVDEGELKEKDLEFPTDFYNAFEEGEDPYTLSAGEVQAIIDDLKGVEVKGGEFAVHRTGDTIVIKFVDAEGTSYVVANDYYSVTVTK